MSAAFDLSCKFSTLSLRGRMGQINSLRQSQRQRTRVSALHWSVLLQEALAINLVAERFRSSRPSHGERARTVATGQAGWEIRALQILVQEPGVEAVPRADRIDRRYSQCGTDETFFSPLRQRAFVTEFHNDQGNHPGELLNGKFRIVGPRDPRGFARVGEQHIDVLQQIFQAPAPEVLRIVIGIERDGESFSFQPAKQLAYIGPQRLLQIER